MGLTKQERAAIDEWLLCDECDDNQRSTVAALGNRAVDLLARRLAGPPPNRIENMRRKFAESFQPGFGLTEDAYVALMLERYTALYQTRSAVVLGDIGTDRARAALSGALAEARPRSYRPDVLRTIEGALVRASSPRFQGTLSDTVVRFGDTVRVRRGALSWDGDESVVLHGSPFEDELFVERWSDDSLSFVAVGEVGAYALSITRQGPSQVTQVDTLLRIGSLSYSTHAPPTAPVATAVPFPQIRYLLLQGTGDNTTDFLRLNPTPLTVTATARWPGLDVVSVGWQKCTGGLPAGNSVSGVVANEAGVPIRDARVTVVGTVLGSLTNASGAFSLTSVPAIAAPGGMVTLRISRIGYRLQEHRVPLNASGLRLGMVAASATRATARNLSAQQLTIPAGECLLLRLSAHGGVRPRIVQLKLTSP